MIDTRTSCVPDSAIGPMSEPAAAEPVRRASDIPEAERRTRREQMSRRLAAGTPAQQRLRSALLAGGIAGFVGLLIGFINTSALTYTDPAAAAGWVTLIAGGTFLLVGGIVWMATPARPPAFALPGNPEKTAGPIVSWKTPNRRLERRAAAGQRRSPLLWIVGGMVLVLAVVALLAMTR